jgi:outer membrane immunogenic protein
VLGALNPPNFGGAFSNTWGTSASSSATRTGWTAGAGAEWKFAQNWSAKLEYLYYDLGSMTTNLGILNNNPSGVPFTIFSHSPAATTSFNGNIVRAGVNYHFN